MKIKIIGGCRPGRIDFAILMKKGKSGARDHRLRAQWTFRYVRLGCGFQAGHWRI